MMVIPNPRHIQQTYSDLSRRRPQSPVRQGRATLDLFSEMFSYSPTFEEMLATYLKNFTGRYVPKSKRVQALNLQVVLGPRELQSGVHLPIRIPVFRVCRRCEGSGNAGFYQCDQCGGEGVRTEIRALDVLIPAGTRPGTNIPVSLGHLGIENLWLNVQVRGANG